MSYVLLVTSSPRGPNAKSSRVGRALADALVDAGKADLVVARDLHDDPPPYVGMDFVSGRRLSEDERSGEQQQVMAISDKLIAELASARFLIIAAPMINLGLPATLKSWFDHVIRAGLTVIYDDHGAKGAVTNHKGFLVLTRGQSYSEAHAPLHHADFQTPYLHRLLSSIGIEACEALIIEGFQMDDRKGEEAVERSLAVIPSLAAAA